MKSLLIATRNEGKMIEVREILRDLPFRLLSLDEFPEATTVAETGGTFEENAVLKAAGYASQTGVFTLADDSGLEVDALGGRPGVQSARYAGEHAGDLKRIEKLLTELAGTNNSDRGARFVSAIAIADPRATILSVSVGMCEGRIAFAPSGARGFGYDPVFVPNGFAHSFGELESDVKNRISHRARALERAHEHLSALTRCLDDD